MEHVNYNWYICYNSIIYTMAAKISGNRGINFSGEFDIKQILENQKKVIQGFGDLKKAASQAVASGGSTSAAQFSSKPLTEYQRELIRIKEETLALAKAKQETAAADRAASLATQAALKEESRLKREQIANEKALKAEQAKRKPTQISDSKAEIDAYNNAANGNKAVTTTLNEKNIAQANATNGLINNSKVVKENDAAEKSNNLTKKQSAQLLAEEKLIQQQNTAALKNNAREMLNAKGSIEQRRAALIRLNRTYDQLSAIERASPAGQRLQGIIGRTTQQVKDLEAATGRAQRNVGNYTGGFAKGLSTVYGGLKTVANILPGLGIATLLGFAINPIVNYISSLDIFKKKVTEAKLAQDNIAKALAGTEYTKAVTNVNELRINIDLARQGLISKESVVKQYNESIGKTTGAVSSLDQAEKELIANGQNYIDVTLLKAAAQIALEEAAKKSYEAEVKRRDEVASFYSGIEIASLSAGIQSLLGDDDKLIEERNAKAEKRRAKEIQLAEEARDKQLAIGKKFQDDAAALAERSGFINFLGNDDGKASESQLKAQQNLQKRVDALLNEAKRKQLSREEEEIQAVKDKFDAIIKEVERFNNNPKNKAKVGRVTELRNELSGQISAIEFRAETDRTLKFIDEQKKVYADYEQYKIDFGKKAADERFKNELDTSISYMEDLRLREAELLSKGNISPVEQERLKAVQDRIKAELDLERKKEDDILRNALNSTKSLYQQALDLDKQYQIDKLALEKSGNATPERLKVLNDEFDLRKKALAKADAEQKIGYAKLLEDLDGMTREKAIESLNNAKIRFKEQYDAGKLTAKDYYDAVAQIEGQVAGLRRSNIFNSIQNSIKDYKDAKKAFSENNSVANEDKVIAARSKMYTTVADRAQEASQAIAGVNEIFSKLGSSPETQNTLNQISGLLSGAGDLAKGIASGDVASIISGSVKLITNAIDLFNFKDKRIAKQIKQYQADLVSLGKAYAALEREVSRAAGSDVYSAQQSQINNLLQQQQKLIAIRNAEQEKKKKDQGRIDDLNNQIDSIPNQIRDIQDSISQNLIQGTFRDLSTSLADALVGAFQAGENGIDALDKSLDAFIANAIKGGLRIALLEKPIKKFTDDLAAFASANNNSIIGFDFDSYRKQLQDAGKLFNDALKGSEEFFKDSDIESSKDGIKGKLQRELTETTASEFLGVTRNIFEVNLKQLTAINQVVSLANNNLAIQGRIEANTFNTVIELQNAVTELRQIGINTSPVPQSSARDLGL